MDTPDTELALPEIQPPTQQQLAELAAQPPKARAAIVLRSSTVEPVLTKMAQALADVQEVSSPDGREQVHRGMMTLKRARTSIAATGKEARDDANAFAKAVIEEEKRLIGIVQPEEQRLASLRDGWDAAREAELAALRAKEQARKDAHEAAIAAIQQQPAQLLGSNADTLARALEDAKTVAYAEECEEYLERYQSANTARVALLENMIERQRFIEDEEARIAEQGRKLEAQRREAEAAIEKQRQAEEARRAEEDRAAEQARQRADQEAADKRADERRAHEERMRLEQEELSARQVQEAEDRRKREAEELAKAEAERAEQAKRDAEAERLAEAERTQAAARLELEIRNTTLSDAAGAALDWFKTEKLEHIIPARKLAAALSKGN